MLVLGYLHDQNISLTSIALAEKEARVNAGTKEGGGRGRGGEAMVRGEGTT